MIAGNVPKHLTVGARTGFLTSMKDTVLPWQQISTTFQMSAAQNELVDLGAAPMPKESKSGVTIQDFIEKNIPVSAKNWDITVWISQNSIDDDQTGMLQPKVRSAGRNFQKHINQEVFKALNAGDDNTQYGLGYDGQDFFDSDHVDKGGNYQTAQDNEYTLGISQTNFETVWVAAQGLRDDQGEFTGYFYDLLVTHPTNRRVAANISSNPERYDVADRAMNPWASDLKAPIFSPELDSTAWYLLASGEAHKPFIVAMKKEPHLQSAWFDPEAPDGGRYYFKFFARYDVFYGDWRLAMQGQT